MHKKFVWLGGCILLLMLVAGIPAPAWATVSSESRSASPDLSKQEIVRGAEIDPNG